MAPKTEDTAEAPPAAKSPNDTAPVARIVLVTGISGAGKTSALKAFEDLDYEAVDNVPLSLIGALVSVGRRRSDGIAFERPLAIGVDIRTRGFDVDELLGSHRELERRGGFEVNILFLDCDDDVLRRRFTETRHRHPLAMDRPIADGIAQERRLLAGLRDRADLLIDTTDMALGDLKRVLAGSFPAAGRTDLLVFLTSFSFARGLPRDADMVLDVRFLRNPHYEPALREQTGRDPAVSAFVAGDPDFQPFFDSLTALLAPLIPRYRAEGKSYLTLALGCTGGRHRSVYTAEKLAKWFEDRGQRVQLHHRDLPSAPSP
jgi:UPF0042 nucleotide-binding protein